MRECKSPCTALTLPFTANVDGSMWSISWSKSSRTRKKAAVSIIDIEDLFTPREKNRLRTSYLGGGNNNIKFGFKRFLVNMTLDYYDIS